MALCWVSWRAASRGDGARALFERGGEETQFHRVDGLAHITAARAGNVRNYAVFNLRVNGVLLAQKRESPFHRRHNVLGGDGLELKHRGAAEQRRVDVKIRVFGGGGDKGDFAVFNELQQRLLLLLIEYWISSRYSNTPLGAISVSSRAMTALMSAVPAVVPLSLTSSRSVVSAMMRASVVLPMPDGP
jgi:hypothetical protein